MKVRQFSSVTLVVSLISSLVFAQWNEFRPPSDGGTPDSGQNGRQPTPEELQRQIQALQQQQQQQLKSQQAAEAEKKKEAEKAAEEPSLNLPIGWFITTGIFAGLGALTSVWSAGPERDLRNPEKHLTRDDTNRLYNFAVFTGVLSKLMFSLSGFFGGIAAYKLQSGLRGYFTAKAQQLMDKAAKSPVSMGISIGKSSAGLAISGEF